MNVSLNVVTVLDQKMVDKLGRVSTAAWNEGEVDALDDVLAQDVEYHAPPLAHIKGLHSYKKYVANTRIAYPDFTADIERSIFQGDVSVIWGTVRGTNTGVSPGTGLPATGCTMDFKSCQVQRWQGDKVVEVWAYNDYLTMMTQLGFVQLPEAA